MVLTGEPGGAIGSMSSGAVLRRTTRTIEPCAPPLNASAAAAAVVDDIIAAPAAAMALGRMGATVVRRCVPRPTDCAIRR